MSLFLKHTDSSSTPTKRSRILLSSTASSNSPPQTDAEDNCLKSDNGENKPEINTVENSNTALEEVIEQHDLGLLNFDTNTGKNLALRGHRKSLQSTEDSNVGNFLALLKLLAIFDPVMKEHLCYASAVRQNLLKGIRRAKYYGVMFDTTPDRIHREQISQVVRYVEVDFEKKCVWVRETFLGFIQAGEKDTESLVDVILKQLADDKMALEDCRSQCYDNVAVMAGHRSGVQQRFNEKNKLTLFVNCDIHSLNLVGLHAAKHDSSRHRRQENDATETRNDANLLFNRILHYELLALLSFWNSVLTRIDRVQKRLQDPTMNFHDASPDLKGLCDYFIASREVLVADSLEEGLNICRRRQVDVKPCRRSQRFIHDVSIDHLLKGMNARFSRLHDLDAKFDFLIDIWFLHNGSFADL
uniref:Uncharacterized protein n=1 Tax=Octopus bimaculoides TaxID=37653 RepID=A0A0L8IEX9_OCTBM